MGVSAEDQIDRGGLQDGVENFAHFGHASAAVLRADTELIVFPILSAIGVIFVTAGFVVPIAVSGRGEELSNSPLSFVIGFLFYLATYFVIFFCNSGLIGAAMIRLKGGDPTVGDGLRIAFSHIGAIFGYALLAATVGMILRAVQERLGLLGKIVVALIGFVWSVSTFLVVPVLVIEGVGPIAGVKRSIELLRKTWGEQVIGNGGIGLVFGLIFVGLIFVSVPLIVFAAMAQSPALLIAAIAVVTFAFMTVAILNATLSSIYTAAVYLYAAEGATGGGFQTEVIAAAFRPKKQ